ncbi:hypothetical protein L0663_04920 [Dyadobacter sp. CY107]|uniref:hypothetical protein n=1 Tax=Dyadobacter fanqingshengii TaxID=2906443 RepID=UPI001F24CEAC|nr:hypothetical protein [Dyadobacter fanqingshengii]MCF2502708.1 hypothetical protein [Dyadobacter fanqingshengii]
MKVFDLATYIIWISTGYGILCFSKIPYPGLRFFIIFQAISTISDLLLIYVIPMGDGVFVRVFYLFLKPIEYFSYVYALMNLNKTGVRSILLMLSVVIMLLFSIYNLGFRLKYQGVTDNLMLIEGILSVILSLVYFGDVFYISFEEDENIKPLWSQHRFWLATSLLFFYLGNIIATGFYHRLLTYSPDFAKSLYVYMNLVLGILQSCMFALTYLIAVRTNLDLSAQKSGLT